ncbi:MAG: lysophospholipase [Spirochaetaceae bacterium]
MNILKIIIINILISAVIYLVIALSLVIINGKKKDDSTGNNLKFDELKFDYKNLPETQTYQTRDQHNLNYRYYPSDSQNVIILIHGSGWHSKYFLPLANNISSNNSAHVYTPDLRGHGSNPETRGDIKYINQLEDDIFDLVQFIKIKHPGSKIIIAGHSSGGGLAVRYAGSKYGKEADAFLLLSPYLKYNAPTMRANSGGWASTHMPRIIGLSMLNNIGIRIFNSLQVIDFNMPMEYRDGTETLSYSYRLNTGYAPGNYEKDLSSIKQKLLVLAGNADESFKAEEFYPEISKYKPDVDVQIIENVTHMGIVIESEVGTIVTSWLDDI